ncbi:hypothetical protein A3Q56_00273 [Intoshia linei]|uniref:Uncharacterized protein n=1 Tax=Intoshia linei TaxID=1819745 RepID=A0A177BEF6_9BILA|nr:hypothetical protein A3Q56_00273 [Intoshia linei]
MSIHNSISLFNHEIFTIPISIDEMIKSNKNKNKLIEKKKISVKVKEFERSLHVDPCLAIINHSDLYFSILVHIKDIDCKEKIYFLGVFLDGANLMTEKLKNCISEPDLSEKSGMLNALTMSCFELCMLLEEYEANLTKMNMTACFVTRILLVHEIVPFMSLLRN